MAADEAQQEPTMEEILASIRKIISEDDEVEPSASAEVDEEDVLDLEPMEDDFDLAPEPEPVMTDDFGEPDFESEDIVAVDDEPDDFDMPEPTPEPPKAAAPQPVVSDTDDKLIEDSVAGFAAGALGKLRGTMPISSDTTLDSLVKELLRPMLKEWLNENLQSIVEAKVEEEVKRISRMSR